MPLNNRVCPDIILKYDMLQFQDDSQPPGNTSPAITKRGNRLVFEFIERTGYILYALGEHRKSDENIPLLVHVLRNQLTWIEELLRIFPSAGIIFPDPIIAQLKEVLSEHSGKYIERRS